MTSLTAVSATATIRERFGVEAAGDGRGGLVVTLAVEQWQPFGRFTHAELGCGFFNFLTAVDWKAEGAEVLCRVENLDARLVVTMRTRLAPGAWRCPTLTGVWRGADWMERECYDMFGVVFDGHPDLRRILLAQDWEGYPLRKDYAVDTPHTTYR